MFQNLRREEATEAEANVEPQVAQPISSFKWKEFAAYLVVIYAIVHIWFLIFQLQNLSLLIAYTLAVFFAALFWYRWKNRRAALEAEARRREERMATLLMQRNVAFTNYVRSHHRSSRSGQQSNNNNNNGNLANNNGAIVRGLSMDEIAGIPTVLCCSGEKGKKQYFNILDKDLFNPQYSVSSCSICLSDCLVGEKLSVLPCMHTFHENCVAEWLARRSTCPICKQTANRPVAASAASPSTTPVTSPTSPSVPLLAMVTTPSSSSAEIAIAIGPPTSPSALPSPRRQVSPRVVEDSIVIPVREDAIATSSSSTTSPTTITASSSTTTTRSPAGSRWSSVAVSSHRSDEDGNNGSNGIELYRV